MSDEPMENYTFIDANPFYNLTREQAEQLAMELQACAECIRARIIEESNNAKKEEAEEGRKKERHSFQSFRVKLDG